MPCLINYGTDSNKEKGEAEMGVNRARREIEGLMIVSVVEETKTQNQKVPESSHEDNQS